MTQFKHGFSGPTGLDYPGVECVSRQIGINFSDEFEKIQIIERTFLKLLSEKTSEQASDGKEV